MRIPIKTSNSFKAVNAFVEFKFRLSRIRSVKTTLPLKKIL